MSPEEIKEVKAYRFQDILKHNAAEHNFSPDCKSSPWVDTSHESCKSGATSAGNYLLVNKSPHVSISWEVVSSTPGSERLRFELSFEVTGEQGWMGMSIGSSDGGMTNADMIIVKKDGDAITVHDYHGTGYVAPIEDAVNHLNTDLIEGEIPTTEFVDGRVTAVIYRNGDTGDTEEDKSLNVGAATKLAFAWSDNNVGNIESLPFYHGTSRKSVGEVNFFSGSSDSKDTLKIVHGMIMSVVWMFNITMGVITARYRAESRSWFGTHVAFQALGTMLTFPMYVLAHWGFVMKSGGSAHSIVGNIIVWSCGIQATFGVHMSMLFEYRVQRNHNKLAKDPSCIVALKYRWFSYLSEKIVTPTCRTHCCCCFVALFACCCSCCKKKNDDVDSKKDREVELANLTNPMHDDTKDAVTNVKVVKVHKVRREIYIHYIHKFYGKTLLLLAYVQVGLGLWTYGAFDELYDQNDNIQWINKWTNSTNVVLCLMFGVWYIIVLVIFVYKEIMWRCGFATFTMIDFADYLLDAVIDGISSCCCGAEGETGDEDDLSGDEASGTTTNGTGAAAAAVTTSSMLRTDSVASVINTETKNNVCYQLALQIDKENKETDSNSLPQLYKKHFKKFVIEIGMCPASILILLEAAGVHSIAEIAYATTCDDLVKYTKMTMKQAEAMVRRSRRILGYVSGVKMTPKVKGKGKGQRQLEGKEGMQRKVSLREPSYKKDARKYLDGRGLKAVASGPQRWQNDAKKFKALQERHKKKAEEKRQKKRMSKKKTMLGKVDEDHMNREGKEETSEMVEIADHVEESSTITENESEKKAAPTLTEIASSSSATTMSIAEAAALLPDEYGSLTEPDSDGSVSEFTNSDNDDGDDDDYMYEEVNDYDKDGDSNMLRSRLRRGSRHMEAEQFVEEHGSVVVEQEKELMRVIEV
jgi:hypothetical protein